MATRAMKHSKSTMRAIFNVSMMQMIFCGAPSLEGLLWMESPFLLLSFFKVLIPENWTIDNLSHKVVFIFG